MGWKMKNKVGGASIREPFALLVDVPRRHDGATVFERGCGLWRALKSGRS